MEQIGGRIMPNNHFRPRTAKSLATPARICAFETLKLAIDKSLFVSQAFDRVMEGKNLKPEEKAFSRLLSVGTTGTVGVLDELINRVLSSPRDIKTDVRIALRISTYELFFLKKSSHAAVDQGVELVRYVSPHATGLANYALRRLSDLQIGFPFGDSEENFDVAIYEQGFPLWLGQRLKKDLGKRNALSIMKEANEPAPLYMMVNACRVDTKKTIELLHGRGIRLLPVPILCGKPDFLSFVFANRSQAGDVAVDRLVQEGALVMSDLSAQTVAQLALPDEEPRRFLEIGAGRGTKTLMLQTAARARYGNQMCLDTIEISPKKNHELTSRTERAHVQINKQYVLNATSLSSIEDDSYDAIFIDAPCSGVGTLRRHPEIRWRLKPEDVSSLAGIGLKMLREASKKVSRGGRITYATCTCFEEENDKVIKRFLGSSEGSRFEILPLTEKGRGFFKSPILGHGSDIHFAAVLTRVR